MGRGGRTGLKRSSNRQVPKKCFDSEDSDEDYVAEVDEVDEQSDELDSLVGDGLEEDSFFEDEDEEEEEDEDENEDADEEEEEEWRTVVKPRVEKGSTKCRKNGVKRPKKRRKVKSDDDEDSDDDDDDDDEFTPDDIESLEEEEEFSMPRTKTKKRGRPILKRKTSSKSRRRKRSAKAIRKPLKKISKTTRSFKRKTESGDDEDFLQKGPTLRGRRKKKKGRTMGGSDSDICSDSSDYEFTISEEEREQIREANQICGRLTTNSRSSRRIQDSEAICEPRKSPTIKKGKEKAEETMNDVGKPVCGICLTEEGKNTIRGTLNCCSHYFCFACIMEWSKVESRCPLCKQRFVTISKLTRCSKGFDLRSSVIPVPERDQVYQPSEEELRDFLNPYENVICTECHQGGDDALMLLCDLCDSPAHTYCVGLGRDVPEGNWYCDGCRPAALGSSHSQTQDLTPDQRTSAGASTDGASTYENMAEIDLNVTIPETPLSQGNGFLSSPRYSSGSFQASSPAFGTGVSTVFGRRRIHDQIRNMLSSRHLPPGADSSYLRAIFNDRVYSMFQQGITTDVGTSHHAQHVDRLQETPSHNVQNRDFFPGRMSHMMGLIGQTSTSENGSAHSHIQWSGLDQINLEASQTQMSSNGQVRPCTSRSRIAGESPSHNRDEDRTDVVKQQVYSIVISQVKSLSRDMNLGHDACAQISRRSTDAIMASYGLEPCRRDVHEMRPPVCLHSETLYVGLSPIAGCCLACFENFVKDVVRRFMDITLGPRWPPFRH